MDGVPSVFLDQGESDLVTSEKQSSPEKSAGNSKQEMIKRLRRLWGVKSSYFIISPLFAYVIIVFCLTFFSAQFIDLNQTLLFQYTTFQRILITLERDILQIQGVIFLLRNHYQGYPLYTNITTASAQIVLDKEIRSIYRDYIARENQYRSTLYGLDISSITSIFDTMKSYELKYSSGVVRNSSFSETLKVLSSTLYEIEQMNFTQAAVEGELSEFLVQNIRSPIKGESEKIRLLIEAELLKKLNSILQPVTTIAWVIYLTNVCPLIMVLLWFYSYIPKQNRSLQHFFRYPRSHLEIAIYKCDYYLKHCLGENKRNFHSLVLLEEKDLRPRKKENADKGEFTFKKHNKRSNTKSFTACNLILLVANSLICLFVSLSNSSNSVIALDLNTNELATLNSLSSMDQMGWAQFIDIQHTFQLGEYQNTNEAANRDPLKEILETFKVSSM